MTPLGWLGRKTSTQTNTWSRLLIQIQILNGKQCRSWSVGFFRSQLIWIYTVCKSRTYPGSAGQGLTIPRKYLLCYQKHPIKISDHHRWKKTFQIYYSAVWLIGTLWKANDQIVKIWSDCSDVQADLCLYQMHMPEKLIFLYWAKVTSFHFFLFAKIQGCFGREKKKKYYKESSDWKKMYYKQSSPDCLVVQFWLNDNDHIKYTACWPLQIVFLTRLSRNPTPKFTVVWILTDHILFRVFLDCLQKLAIKTAWPVPLCNYLPSEL